jgi:hypothetical protein
LHPTQFLARLQEPYALSKVAMRAFLIPPRNSRLNGLRGRDQIECLDSFHDLYFSAKPGRSLSRIAGWVVLVHEDRAVIHRDWQQIRHLERSGLYQIEPDL